MLPVRQNSTTMVSRRSRLHPTPHSVPQISTNCCESIGICWSDAIWIFSKMNLWLGSFPFRQLAMFCEIKWLTFRMKGPRNSHSTSTNVENNSLGNLSNLERLSYHRCDLHIELTRLSKGEAPRMVPSIGLLQRTFAATNTSSVHIGDDS
jgi:hypothetical protein